MSHFTWEEGSDYVRGLVSDSVARAMRAHLDGGCARCGRAMATSEAINRLAATDRQFVLPEGDIRTVKAMFCLDHPEEAPVLSALQLIFDSNLAPVEGVRSGLQATERNLMYESDTVDLNVLLKASGENLQVAGGLTSPDGGPIGDIPVALLHRDSLQAQALSGKQGDFILPEVPAASLTLRLLLDDRELVEVELPEVAGGSN